MTVPVKWNPAFHSEDELWVCQSCGAELHADCVGDKCPACGAETEDEE